MKILMEMMTCIDETPDGNTTYASKKNINIIHIIRGFYLFLNTLGPDVMPNA